MKKLLTILILLVPAITFAQEEDVKNTFEAFKTAMSNGNSDEVLKLASTSSVDYYDNMLDMILYGDSAEVAKLPLVQRIGVLGSRARIPKDTLMDMEGKDFLQYSMDANKQNAQQIQMLGIGDVLVGDDNTASGQVTMNGQALPMSISFVEEGGDWKIDMSSLENMGEGQLQNMMSQSNMDFNQFLKMALSQQGITADDSIWQPLAER